MFRQRGLDVKFRFLRESDPSLKVYELRPNLPNVRSRVQTVPPLTTISTIINVSM